MLIRESDDSKRCIRHTNDYGAIILLDERFLEKRTVDSISKWIRPVITNQPKFSAAMESLAAFFVRNAQPPAAVVAAAGKRWGCGACARPLSLAATPTSFLCAKAHMLEIARALEPSTAAETTVLVFDPASLNAGMLRRCEQAVYSQADGVAYSDLGCACATRVGAVVEAGNLENKECIGQCWVVAAAVIKIE